VSDIKCLRVFLSAPGDVLAARAVVRDVTDKFAAEFEQSRTHLDLVSWDDPDNLQSLDANLTPDRARALGRPLPAECDVVVVIVWSRMGTPLTHDGEAYLSATHFECESAIRAAHPPRFLVYRWTAPAEQAWEDFATGETADERQQQRDAVERFVAGIRSAAIPVTPFASIAEFETLLTAHLPGALADALAPLPKPAPATSTTAPTTETSAAPPIIFLSAVSDEFRSYREHLKGALERAAQVPSIIQEQFDAVGQGTLGGLDARIRRCTAVVHLIGDMPGYFPPPNAVRELVQRNPALTTLLGLGLDELLEPANAISYTQWEAYLAILHGKHLFLAEAARDAKREPASYRREPALLASQQAHRERLRKLMDRWHELLFDGPDDIGSKLLPALSAQHPRHFSGASLYSLGARQFDAYYLEGRTLDGKDVPAPFGGRRREMEHLDRWLDDPARDPRLLVSSPAGRGKSALLAQWMKALREAKRAGPDGWQLVFVPISNRFQTNRVTTYLELLVRQLAQAAGEYVPPPSIDAEQFYRSKANQLMSGLAGAGKRVLLVIDGLDEALDDERLANLLPATLPPTLKVLVSARWLAEDRGGAGWLTRLGWTSASRPADHDLVVEKLDVGAIEDVLVRMGAPIEPVGRDRPLVTRLAELTEGEPLLLRFYAEDLWLKTSARSPITLDVLDNMQPGFGPYFKTWLQDQGGVAADAGTQVDANTTDAVLAILGFAKGALTAKDLLGVAAAGFPTLPWRLVAKPHVAPFRRFAIGDGSDDFPYVFSHPKVAEFIRTDECKELADQAATAFFLWGRGHVARLNASEGTERLRLKQASSYALDHYTDHLKDVGDTATAADYMAMVEDGWRRAKERHDGGPAGFAADVRAAWAACRRDGDIAHLGAQWRCALVLSSIKSVGTNIPGPLLVELVKDGTLSPQQARHYAELKGPNEEAVTALAGVAVAISDNAPAAADVANAAVDLAMETGDLGLSIEALALAPHLERAKRAALLAEALASAKAMEHAPSRARVLAALAPHLEPAKRTAVLAEALAATMRMDDDSARARMLVTLVPCLESAQRTSALAAAKAIQNKRARAEALVAFAEHLDPIQRPTVLAEALASAKSVDDDPARARLLTALASHLDPAQRQDALTEALGVARAMSHDWDRTRALSALVPCLDSAERQAVLTEALVAARAIDREDARAEALAELSPYFDPPQRTAVLAEALTAANALGEDSPLELGEIAPYLDPAQRTAVLAAVTLIGDEEERAEALIHLASHLEPIQRTAAFTEALAAIRAIRDVGGRAKRLAALAPRLEPLPRQTVLAEALAAAKAIDPEAKNDTDRMHSLLALAPHLEPVQRTDAIAAAWAISDEEDRFQALAALSRFLDPGQRQALLTDALLAAEAIADKWVRASSQLALAPLLDLGQRRAATADALAIAKTIGHEWARARALSALAPHLDEVQRDDAMTVGRALEDESARAEVLAAFVPNLATAERQAAIAEVLSAVKMIRADWDRARILSGLAPHLHAAQCADVLAAAKEIGNQRSRSEALAALALYLDPAQFRGALTAVKAITDEESRFRALAALAQKAADAQSGELMVALLDTSGEIIRANALGAITQVTALTSNLGGPAAVADLHRAIVDVCRWYP
jgi:hypothetical protein